MLTELKSTSIPAAVIGLGQIGSRFDEDPGRTAVWSHVGAYISLPRIFNLIAAVDVSADNANAFRKRCPDVPVYGTTEDMLRQHRPQIVSICTPAEAHANVLFKLLEYPDVKLIWCEKPLSLRLEDATRMVDECRRHGVSLMTSFNRRVMPLWQRVLLLVENGTIGKVRSIRIALPNRLFSIGSHAIDLAIFIGGAIEEITSMTLPALAEGGEPAVSALVRYASGVGGIIQVTGKKSQLIVEAEVIGDDGRLFAREDNSSLVLERFVSSHRYAGYRELGDLERHLVQAAPDYSPLIAIAQNAAAHLQRQERLICDGDSALGVQQIIERMNPMKPASS